MHQLRPQYHPQVSMAEMYHDTNMPAPGVCVVPKAHTLLYTQVLLLSCLLLLPVVVAFYSGLPGGPSMLLVTSRCSPILLPSRAAYRFISRVGATAKMVQYHCRCVLWSAPFLISVIVHTHTVIIISRTYSSWKSSQDSFPSGKGCKRCWFTHPTSCGCK